MKWNTVVLYQSNVLGRRNNCSVKHVFRLCLKIWGTIHHAVHMNRSANNIFFVFGIWGKCSRKPQLKIQCIVYKQESDAQFVCFLHCPMEHAAESTIFVHILGCFYTVYSWVNDIARKSLLCHPLVLDLSTILVYVGLQCVGMKFRLNISLMVARKYRSADVLIEEKTIDWFYLLTGEWVECNQK